MRVSKWWADSRKAWAQHCPPGDIKAGEPASGHLSAGSPRCLRRAGQSDCIACTLRCWLMYPPETREGTGGCGPGVRDDLIW